LFYGGFQPPFHSDFDGCKVVVIPHQPKIHIAEKQCFHPKVFYKMKGKRLSVARIFLPLDMRLSLTSYLSLWEAMPSSFDLSYPLSIQQALDLCAQIKMNHRLYMEVLFGDGLAMLVAILLGKITRLIKLVDSLSTRISSLLSISLSFISFHDCMCIYTYDLLCV